MTIPPDHELAALRALLELRTRERDTERERADKAERALNIIAESLGTDALSAPDAVRLLVGAVEHAAGARRAAIEEAAKVCEDACGQCEEYVGRDLTCPTCPARLAFDIRSLLDTEGNGHG